MIILLVSAIFLSIASAASIDGQAGCLFDGRVYAPHEEIYVQKCLAKFECLGNNNLGPITSLYGICDNDKTKREADGQSGCSFDGRVYAANQIIDITGTGKQMKCLGHNLYTFL